MRRVALRFFCLVIVCVVGGFFGQIYSEVSDQAFPRGTKAPQRVFFLPHHMPKDPGGITFRFAMAHDVIHERYARHGAAYYRERDRITREKLAKLPPGDPARYPLLDDIGTGLDRLGRSDEATALFREKLTDQKGKGLAGRDLYTTYANLGTFLIHGSFARALGGDAAAKARFREGIEFINESVKVNPEAHFGRERWQAAVAEFLIAAVDDPSLLQSFDCLGNSLGLKSNVFPSQEWQDGNARYGQAASKLFRYRSASGRLSPLDDGAASEDRERWEKSHDEYRSFIVKVGAESGWDKVGVPSYRQPAPFDEPMLGIIGMWRQGGGANAHFALAIGETMLRVGQRYIAWAAFERASRLADRYSADPATRLFLKEHCSKRQKEIADQLSPGPSQEELESEVRKPIDEVNFDEPNQRASQKYEASLRKQFDAELAFGEAYQRAYQEYEAKQIEAGISIEAPDFYDNFDRQHPSIATPPGDEEWIPVVLDSEVRRGQFNATMPWMILFAGFCCLPAALLFRFYDAIEGRHLDGATFERV